MLRVRPFLCILTVMVLLVGCSRTDIVYLVIHSTVERRAIDHLLLDSHETSFVKLTINQGFDDIRVNILPVIALKVRDWADRIENGHMTQDADARLTADGRIILGQITATAAPYAAKVLIHHHSPKKRAHLKARMTERLAEKHEDRQHPRDERIEEWVERTVSHFERLSGDLTDDQIAIVESFAGEAVNDHDAWLKNRAKRQQIFINFLAKQPSEDEIEDMVTTIILHPYELVDPDYKHISNRRWDRNGRMVGSLIRSLNDEQRTELVKSLRIYADDFEDLAKG